MRALVARRLDGPDAIELIETAVPEPAEGQLRIKVAAAAVNPVDLAVSAGLAVEFGLTAAREQFGLGWDLAGTVDAVGPNTEAPAQAVVGVADLLGRSLKTHAEYVVLDVDAVVRAPEGVNLANAATFGLNGLTALQAVNTLQGQTVLVTGAAGGVGGYAVELAKHRGLTVIASAGPADEELVRRLGADHFVDRNEDLAAAVRRIVPAGVDGVVDAAVVGIGAQEAVRNGGRHLHLQPGPRPPHLRGITVDQLFIHTNRPDLEELVRLVEAGVLSTRIADTYGLEDAAIAYKRLAAGGVRGRVVLLP
ncbi:NADPH:quinone reductase-like Zn-dependent oxidoreductase [Kribbella rubisoli]|uniref:NADPH:quinone reductase-like Zn-dependent oxidoreductase n=1 Tax=Kribbella rubisoli TaxID=3075929 RepID=A0A4Q7X829_9ACTN|nr:NADP-dependent oxidoreductase [Kribbella rubisoli]RZU18619.1 NADPH:quinone reductase-like Zn-dependent oxidoreductase [Kribbella rubisoli]